MDGAAVGTAAGLTLCFASLLGLSTGLVTIGLDEHGVPLYISLPLLFGGMVGVPLSVLIAVLCAGFGNSVKELSDTLLRHLEGHQSLVEEEIIEL